MTRKPILLTLLFALIGLVLVSGVSAGTLNVDINDGTCKNDGTGTSYCNIQFAINAALPGDTINVAAGTYAEILSITTNDISVIGADESTVIIDATAATGYHLTVDADDVTLKNFTLNGNNSTPASYGIKASGKDITTKYLNFTLENVTVNATYRTGVDLNGIDGAFITNVTVNNVPYGNGVSLTDVDNAVLTNITTSGNAWGGVAIYTYGRYYPLGSDNIAVNGLVGDEPNPFYIEIGNYNDPGNPAPVTNLSAPQFAFTVLNNTYRPGAENFTHYFETEAEAVAFALALPTPLDSVVIDLATGNPITAPGMSIQAAVDAASPGDTVNVQDGTYEEQVIIDKDLNLVGESTSTIIQSPTNLSACATSSYSWYAIVCVINNANATISNFTVDGLSRGNANYKFMGVAFRNAGGGVDTLTIKDIRETPFSGTQHGVGLNAYNDDAATRTLSIINTTFTGFQKNAVAVATGGTSVLNMSAQSNDVQGAGATDVTAQNGIQAYQAGGTLTGDITGNTISGIAYDNTNATTKWVASSILNYYADVDVINNTVTNGHVGVYNYDGSSTIDNNDITIEKIGVYAFGIIASDPPQPLAAPFGDGDLSNTAAVKEKAPDAVSAVLNVIVDNNTVAFSGQDNTDTFGIEVDTGFGPDDISFSATGNDVSGFDVGVELYECQSSCDVGTLTSFVANQNCLYNNTYGMRSNISSLNVDGKNNWWGEASGPYHPVANPTGIGDEVSDYVNFAPWLDACQGGSSTANWENQTTGELYGSFQAAVDDASPGDVIVPYNSNVQPGGVINTPGITIDLGGGTYGPGSPFAEINAADVVIQNGTLDGGGTSDPAILVNAGGDNFTLQNMEVHNWQDGVQIASSVVSFKMVENFVHDNADAGLQIDNGVTLTGIVTIEGNLFKDNTGNGIQNNSGSPISTDYNSWGDVAGPTGTDGDGVSNDVNFMPWNFAEIYLDVDPDNESGQRNVSEGEIFDVALKAEAENLYGLTFLFTYDDSLLTLNSTTFEAPWLNSCTQLSTVSGTVSYRCNLISGPEWDSGKIATFNFTANGSGLVGNGPWQNLFDIASNEADTSAAATGGVKVFVNNAGYNSPSTPDRDITDVNDGQIDIIGIANFTGFVDLQGRPNDMGAMLEVFDSQLKSSATKLADGTSSSGGAYTTSYIGLNKLLVGNTYYLLFDAPLFLPTTTVVSASYINSELMTIRPLTSLNNVVLLGGDATDDNVITINDATCIGGDYGTSTSTCGSGSSDVNGDGPINILDLVLMGGNYSKEFSPWTQP